MKLSKRKQHRIAVWIEEALWQIEKLNQGFLRSADGTRLDVVKLMLEKIQGKVVKNARRRHERSVQETGRD